MVPVRFKTEIQYEPVLVSINVQYLVRTGRCARFVSVGVYFDISSPRLSILDMSCSEHKLHTVLSSKMCVRARATQTHTYAHARHTQYIHTRIQIYIYIYIYMHIFSHTRSIHPHTHTPTHTHTNTHTQHIMLS